MQLSVQSNQEGKAETNNKQHKKLKVLVALLPMPRHQLWLPETSLVTTIPMEVGRKGNNTLSNREMIR
jgi:hypothetical protein